MLKKIKFLVVVLFVAMAIPSFAFNAVNFGEVMTSVAYTGEALDAMMHPGVPNHGMNPHYAELINKQNHNWKKIEDAIASIESKKQIEKAQEVIAQFKLEGGSKRSVANVVERSLNRRIKFLEIHGSI
jgi:hypothetical protein